MIPPRTRRSSARAFTVVELLVTVAVIAILVGLLVPMLGKAKAAAHATRSMSNLRQWGTAMQAWGNINDERVFALTSTLDYALFANVVTRAEARWDTAIGGSNLRPFDGEKNDVSLTLNVIYKF